MRTRGQNQAVIALFFQLPTVEVFNGDPLVLSINLDYLSSGSGIYPKTAAEKLGTGNEQIFSMLNHTA